MYTVVGDPWWVTKKKDPNEQTTNKVYTSVVSPVTVYPQGLEDNDIGDQGTGRLAGVLPQCRYGPKLHPTDWQLVTKHIMSGLVTSLIPSRPTMSFRTVTQEKLDIVTDMSLVHVSQILWCRYDWPMNSRWNYNRSERTWPGSCQ